MGSLLAETSYGEKIEHLVKSVKDLFGCVFFISVGMLIDPDMLFQYAGPVALITLITILGKTLSTAMGALVSGQTLKTSVQAGMSLSQIGEFSFIIATLGMTLKVTSEFLYPIAVAVSAITTFTTPYMIRVSDPVYKWLNKVLPVRFIRAVDRYSNRPPNIANSSGWRKFIRAHLLNALLQLVLIVGIIILSVNYLLPFIESYLEGSSAAKIIGLVITFAMIAPFLWALAIRQPKRETIRQLFNRTRSRLGLIVFQTLRLAVAVSVIALLVSRFFNTTIAIVATVIIALILGLLSKRIRTFYLQIEDRFLANFYEKDNTKKPHDDTSSVDHQ